MRHNLLKKFYHPTLFFFLLPLFQIIMGFIFSIRYESLHIFSFILLYFLVLINQMLENILLRIPISDFTFSKKFFFTLEFLNLLIILYFGIRYSWNASVVLFLFSLLIQIQFLLTYYDLEVYATLVAVLLKTLFLNSFSFYIGTGFIQLRTVIYFVGLLIPFYLYEIARVRPEMKKQVITTLMALSYVVGIILLWSHLGAFSLFLLLSAPFGLGLYKNDFTRISTSIFAINFAIFYVILIMVSVIR